MSPDPTERFTDRVENYVKYRPRYPTAVLDTLRAERGLTADSVIADIGSGTGILTGLFLSNGNPVYAVEPNDAMRAAAERELGADPKFVSVAGRAEATTLPDDSIDFVVAGQAFHWFDRDAARVEFKRILKENGRVILLWNQWQQETPFGADYSALLAQFAAPDYRQRRHTNVTEGDALDAFFAPDGYTLHTFPNEQTFGFKGLKGRVLSASYAPLPGHPNYEPMLAAMRRLFDRHQVDGRVRLDYTTRLYDGRLA